MAGHGLSIRKLENGDIGLCTGPPPPKMFNDMPLFRRPNIADMIEVLRQLSLQAVQMQARSQWEAEQG